MVYVTCEISECSDGETTSIKIHSHFDRKDLVDIEIDGKRYTVAGKDLKTAVDNCMNTDY